MRMLAAVSEAKGFMNRTAAPDVNSVSKMLDLGCCPN